MLRIQDIAAAVLLVSVAVYHIINAFGTVNWEDESFYLTIPYRLISGDSLVSDEWHLSQFSSIFLYLPVKVYMAVRGSADGIIFASRLLFICIHAAVSCVVYIAFRKHGIGAVFAGVTYFMFAPMSVFSVNYNSLCLTFLVLSAITLMKASWRRTAPAFLLCGAFYAMAVINNPVIVIIYIIYTATAAAFALTKYVRQQLPKNRKGKKTSRISRLVADFYTGATEICENAADKKAFLLITAGISCIAFIAIIYFYKAGGTLRSVFANTPMLLKDPEHDYFREGGVSFLRIGELFKTFFENYPWQFPFFIVILLACVCDFRRKLSPVWFSAGAALFAVFTMKSMSLFNSSRDTVIIASMLPLFVFGSICFACIQDRAALLKITAFIYIPGILCSLCAYAASNMKLTALCFGYALADIACCIYIAAAAKQLIPGKAVKPPVKTGIAAFFVIVVAATFVVQVYCEGRTTFHSQYIYSDDYITIEKGPYAKLKIDSSSDKNIGIIMSDIDKIKEQADADSRILITGNMPWAYIYAGMRVGAPTCWQSATYIDRLNEYYAMNPDNIPDYVYVTAFSFPDYSYELYSAKRQADYLCEYFNCKAEKTRGGYILKTGGTISPNE